jgi:hypothetical protein
VDDGDQSGLNEGDQQVHAMSQRREAVIGYHDGDGRRIVGSGRRDQPRQHGVAGFHDLVRFGAKGTMLVLGFVQGAQVNGHETRSMAAQNIQGEARFDLVRCNAGIVAHEIGA